MHISNLYLIQGCCDFDYQFWYCAMILQAPCARENCHAKGPSFYSVRVEWKFFHHNLETSFENFSILVILLLHYSINTVDNKESTA
ncbi:MAG: hypothetical protein WCG04_00985 [Alphaproteobacteria bacterium]